MLDNNCEGRQSSIHLRQVEQDGITFREEWQSVTLLVANLTTEKTIVEGPWMIYRLLYIIKNYTQIEKLTSYTSNHSKLQIKTTVFFIFQKGECVFIYT